jgi:hypothetical protein
MLGYETASLKMDSLLTAASVLLALIGVVYALWYEELKQAIEREMPRHHEDREPILIHLRSVYWSRAVPLTLASISVTAVFVPPAIDIVVESAQQYARYGIRNIGNYDAVATSIVLIEVFLIMLSVQVTATMVRLRRHIRGHDR